MGLAFSPKGATGHIMSSGSTIKTFFCCEVSLSLLRRQACLSHLHVFQFQIRSVIVIDWFSYLNNRMKQRNPGLLGVVVALTATFSKSVVSADDQSDQFV